MIKAVELNLELVRGRGPLRPFHVIVGAPRRAKVDWYCPVRFKSQGRKALRVFGVDSWQALILALRFVEINLRHEVRQGGQFFWLGRKVSVSRLFATRLSRA